ncbi:Ubiquinone binding protein Coq10 [Taphrina deformans PYCC 5710]|uniref:Ubiquinone binding protein Coq10 n=1 Tax=Taphrina deformans (strain PYCC 5710 / ATCC 11124 / CBS 356.35 / IMI 108563 / JCM 9778 / NBRC 8474) TaxID=1097556 RepID=R4X9F8_TAPDE|nr:Ubiquinone binding protein Coq10 [Taphrina deformans PYCC 5710]|eukprot:CCG80849.1 Ubiquinone binding protein Coq10 [Taphrina deformans PYCC 5710]
MLRTVGVAAVRPRSPLTRPFFSASSATLEPRRFTVAKTLPHSRAALFRIISDIDAYASFVPYCLASRVTESGGDGAPTRADLTVGFKGYRESFSSLVRCVAPDSVEALALHHPLFERLVTAWRLQDHQTPAGSTRDDDHDHDEESCRVHLDIEYRFSNPMYGALSGAVLPKVADQIIEAFERRAEQVLRKD